MNFTSFGFHKNVAAGISAAGYSTPTPIQEKAIPQVMQGRDLMGLAQTGTGKTAAFVLPILHRLMQKPGKGVRALIIAPTRELAEQTHEAINALGAQTNLKSVSVYGGVNLQRQVTRLKQADIVVACPGRLLDHLGRKNVDLSRVEMLVLDEADQMFDMGFLPDIRKILTFLTRKGRQTLMFSATMPVQIKRLAGEVLHNHALVQIGRVAPAETVKHAFYPVAQHLKTALLLQLLGSTGTESVLVFTRTKHKAKQLGNKLTKAGFSSTSLQGNLSQSRRVDAMNGFKSGKYRVLVATDIAARGIDVANVSHVINYDMPSTPETYMHRIGRTGRAERRGEAFTFITNDDRQMVRAVNRAIGSNVEQRTVQDFNYRASTPETGRQAAQAPPRQPAKKKKSRQDSPPVQVRKKSGSRRRADREAKGAFTWVSAG
ncbi:Superfamily II DNA and RNA helicase [Desulfatibacillum alkenivorans DSM 16219]|uniref:Superfamily II DNA and RNA helicase n=1 Tax=Desulfatibacillum alkenivorans DSM 16219 TaxID=1121393 RepID=A0A1M6QCX4_9BACT|nr:DEAD/DEAH box helicase [Desulfatibacillum alkenivorans]SHK17927.1 Superfamily II DNA and RNA helicase [Desulfatibacillum alkenivorans DSM 16219]